MEKVAVESCKSYDEKKVLNAVRDAVKKTEVKINGRKVLIKANQLSSNSPDKHVTTHPSVIKAIVEVVREEGGEPYIGDSPGFGKFLDIAETTGLKGLAQLVELDEPVKKKVSGKIMKSFQVSRKLDGFDMIINAPKRKTHILTTYTGSVKNLFGCIPGNLKAQMHLRLQDPTVFSEMLLDLYLLIKPELTVMDAVIGMEGQGPSGGDPKKAGMIIASTDSLALDEAAASAIGIDAPIIRLARKRGILKEKRIIGNLNDVKFKPPRQAHVPGFLYWIGRRMLISRPYVMREKCTGCGTCKSVCPADAITMNNYPYFDYSKCIRCYCCHEMCPESAVELKQGVIVRMAMVVKRIFMK